MSNVWSLEFFLLFQSLLEENRASNKSSPFISFFGHSGCVSPWLKPKVLSFPFDGSPQGIFWIASLSFYHRVSMRWLFLRAWSYPFLIHAPTISTFFAWLQCLFSISALRLTSSFVSLCGKYLNIILRILCMNVATMFSIIFIHFPGFTSVQKGR